MIIKVELKHQDNYQDECLHSHQHPHLHHPMLIQESMNNSLQKWSESIGNCHQNIGCFEPEHISKEVLGEFAILSVVARVTGKSSHNHYEEDENV